MYGELGSAQVEHILHLGTTGHLGCYGDARPYVAPINYAYDGQHIYGYTREVMKLRLMRASNRLLSGRPDREHHQLAERHYLGDVRGTPRR